MPTTTANVSLPPTTPKKVLSAIHNIPKRMRSRTFRAHAPPSRPAGKENVPPGERNANANPQGDSRPPRPPYPRRRPAPLLPQSSIHASGLDLRSPAPVRDLDTPSPRVPVPGPAASSSSSSSSWAPKDGQIVIKIWLPSTDDIWALRVPQDVSLAAFRARVAAKLGFEVSFSAVRFGTLRTVGDEEAFRRWVAGRVRAGRNTTLTAHRLVLQ
ncbi:hypothetical protein K466DRAFT_592675 [Polyporus arcularius HHB13444]|uniref:Uncharacterized protein n=1 Tax=Polyporus arcularius HHB13444 TaxID=1314778 RepID=A0A5C3NQ26_9APHY|nr:hypothetical protein K466DRAFT_592675 [Polyporus arcularius HHB13444]